VHPKECTAFRVFVPKLVLCLGAFSWGPLRLTVCDGFLFAFESIRMLFCYPWSRHVAGPAWGTDVCSVCAAAVGHATAFFRSGCEALSPVLFYSHRVTSLRVRASPNMTADPFFVQNLNSKSIGIRQKLVVENPDSNVNGLNKLGV